MPDLFWNDARHAWTQDAPGPFAVQEQRDFDFAVDNEQELIVTRVNFPSRMP
jgi:hypothetical protein